MTENEQQFMDALPETGTIAYSGLEDTLKRNVLICYHPLRRKGLVFGAVRDGALTVSRTPIGEVENA